MKQIINVLLIEDDDDDVLLIKEYLEEIQTFSLNVTWQSNLELAKSGILSGDYEIFLIDYQLGGENGLDLLKFMHQRNILTPAILLTGQGGMEIDINASQSGASDYLEKSELNASILERSIRYAVSKAKIIRELDEKEKKYRSLFERSIDPIFLATSNLTLKEVNQAFLIIFGYKEGETTAVGVSNIFENQEDYQYFANTLKATEQVKDFEVSLLTKSGETKFCILNCTFIPDQSEDFCCYQAIIHDLSIRKQAEHDLLVAERLSLTGKLARTIAHEVRNPLFNMFMALDNLRSEIPPENESAKQYGDIIQRNANRIEQLVSEMLNSSKPKELNLNNHAIHEILDGTLVMAIDRINLSQVKLHKNYTTDLPKVLVDKDKIMIALLNIIINAIEAMVPEKGVLTIGTTLSNKIIAVEISDNGKGIASPDIKKLFEPFFTNKPNGIGLGLTSTKNILNSHNIKIEVSSELGIGTSFKIEFKLAG